MRDHKRFPGGFIDYNGVGAWSAAGIQERYRTYSERASNHPPAPIPRMQSEHRRTWVYPLMNDIIALIEIGDPAAIIIGIEFIEQDDFFDFGKILKSNTARALRRQKLTDDQQERVRRRIVSMMLGGYAAHEFHEYKRLLRKVGMGNLWPVLESGINRDNPYVMRFYNYFKGYCLAPNG